MTDTWECDLQMTTLAQCGCRFHWNPVINVGICMVLLIWPPSSFSSDSKKCINWNVRFYIVAFVKNVFLAHNGSFSYFFWVPVDDEKKNKTQRWSSRSEAYLKEETNLHRKQLWSIDASISHLSWYWMKWFVYPQGRAQERSWYCVNRLLSVHRTYFQYIDITNWTLRRSSF